LHGGAVPPEDSYHVDPFTPVDEVEWVEAPSLIFEHISGLLECRLAESLLQPSQPRAGPGHLRCNLAGDLRGPFAEERIGILEGSEIIDRMSGAKTGIGGFLDVASQQGWTVVGTVAAGATPSANVEADAYDDLKGRMLDRLKNDGPFDGVLLHLHGAMLAKNAPDAEGDLWQSYYRGGNYPRNRLTDEA
jgi:hypothetical protein